MIHGYWLPTKDGTLKLYIVQHVTKYVMNTEAIQKLKTSGMKYMLIQYATIKFLNKYW